MTNHFRESKKGSSAKGKVWKFILPWSKQIKRLLFLRKNFRKNPKKSSKITVPAKKCSRSKDVISIELSQYKVIM